MRTLALLMLLTPAAAMAQDVALYTLDPSECGTYAEGTLTNAAFFPGGEAGTLGLFDGRDMPFLKARLYDGALVNEGDPYLIGPVLILREYDWDGVEFVRVFTDAEPMQERRVCPN